MLTNTKSQVTLIRGIIVVAFVIGLSVKTIVLSQDRSAAVADEASVRDDTSFRFHGKVVEDDGEAVGAEVGGSNIRLAGTCSNGGPRHVPEESPSRGLDGNGP